ncbi:dihydroorotase [Acidaminobacter sp. JC074]|uniref:dihydroorotase n=1 Tax=Acidaminobacter sp. JC074 TaxID=2530199 RepID=UPI001F0EEF04|nr:dihydroorotase [Acidaminobacter sp. JC074]MCH4890531.1 dihydroorotase [Acidaminobacter sp. JC074]
MGILIKNGRVINPKTSLDQITDILIEEGKVTSIADNIEGDYEIIDASGKIVCPGFVDLHVHLREPGFEDKETVETGTKAAVAGGVTTVVCMPNTKPAIHSKEVVELIQSQAKKAGYAKVEIAGAITKDISGNILSDMDDMIEAGIVSVSDDGRTTPSLSLMNEAFHKIKKPDLVLMAHTEDDELAKFGCMNDGERSKTLGLIGIPNEAESNIVKRDIELCKEADSRLHICHVSTQESMDYIIESKKAGVKVTVEICPHHFILTDDIVNKDDAYSKVNPPIRARKDRDYMLKCIEEGHIDCIVTDHAPHEDATKKVAYDKAAFGISGIETSFALSYTYLVKTGRISLSRLVELMSVQPAEIIRKDIGDISPGKTADIAIIDLDNTYTIDSSKFYSKGKNTPFNGFDVQGVVDYTLVNGQVVFRR